MERAVLRFGGLYDEKRLVGLDDAVHDIHNGRCFTATSYADNDCVFRQSIQGDIKGLVGTCVVMLDEAQRDRFGFIGVKIDIEIYMVMEGITRSFFTEELNKRADLL